MGAAFASSQRPLVRRIKQIHLQVVSHDHGQDNRDECGQDFFRHRQAAFLAAVIFISTRSGNSIFADISAGKLSLANSPKAILAADAKGKCKIAGVEYFVSAWTRTSASGVRYQSLAFHRWDPDPAKRKLRTKEA
jgi:hypothetical protein